MRYEEGSTALRLWVGMGAGSSYFDARIELRGGPEENTLGNWQVDRNSWGLGGAFAATQTVEEFMKSAAEKVGKELAAAKKQGFIDPKAAKK
jgi:hypothetical protein